MGFLILNAVSIICVVCATILIAMGIDHGWGWLLFIALCSLHIRCED